MKELILGGVRSGKSRLAEAQARASGLAVTYVATAPPTNDLELQRRIQEHRRLRPEHWQTVEEPIALADRVNSLAAHNRCILVDCLTLWLTNLLCSSDKTCLVRERDALLRILPRSPGHIILVSNECGLGVTPLGELTREFLDEAGLLHQQLAAVCDRVTLTIAGLPQRIKG